MREATIFIIGQDEYDNYEVYIDAGHASKYSSYPSSFFGKEVRVGDAYEDCAISHGMISLGRMSDKKVHKVVLEGVAPVKYPVYKLADGEEEAKRLALESPKVSSVIEYGDIEW